VEDSRFHMVVKYDNPQPRISSLNTNMSKAIILDYFDSSLDTNFYGLGCIKSKKHILNITNFGKYQKYYCMCGIPHIPQSTRKAFEILVLFESHFYEIQMQLGQTFTIYKH
jgi:hypothetical protein